MIKKGKTGGGPFDPENFQLTNPEWMLIDPLRGTPSLEGIAGGIEVGIGSNFILSECTYEFIMLNTLS